jgi:hypothetical protein
MAATKSCPGCGESFRKGKRRGILQEDGSVRVAMVCGACSKRAFAVVRPVGDAACLCKVCKVASARICAGCARKARADLIAPVLMALRGASKAFGLQGDEASEKAYDHAVAALVREAEQG